MDQIKIPHNKNVTQKEKILPKFLGGGDPGPRVGERGGGEKGGGGPKRKISQKDFFNGGGGGGTEAAARF